VDRRLTAEKFLGVDIGTNFAGLPSSPDCRFRTEQPTYSILNRGIEAEVLPVVQRYGMGTLRDGDSPTESPRQPSMPVALCGDPTGFDSGEPRWRR
jgi:hypothetical protein